MDQDGLYVEKESLDVEAAKRGTSVFKDDQNDEFEHVVGGRPRYVLPILFGSVCLGAISGPILKDMERDGAVPLALAMWRHEVSAMFMLPFAVWQWCSMSSKERSLALTWAHARTICLCALGLACHFGFWIWSLDNTSLTHSVFLCILSPVFVSLFTLFREGWLQRSEAGGVLLGLLGSMILALGAEVEGDVNFTWIGDVAALTSACGFAVYIVCGKELCRKLPIFVYLWPVNMMVLAYLSAVSFMLTNEQYQLASCHDGFFSWTSKAYAWRTLLLGLGPGFLCHWGYNTTLGYVKPLLISVGMSVQPPIASFLGWWMGQTATPGWLTMLGGMVTVSATIVMSCFSGHEVRSMESDHALTDQALKQPLLSNHGDAHNQVSPPQ